MFTVMTSLCGPLSFAVGPLLLRPENSPEPLKYASLNALHDSGSYAVAARGWNGLSIRMNSQITAPKNATNVPVLSAATQPIFSAKKGMSGPTMMPETLPPVFISPQAGAE
jgi:hypothetical protein